MPSDIFGQFHDRSKVSLIGRVIVSSTQSGNVDEERLCTTSVFPHLVIFGSQHIKSTDEIIFRMDFRVDDATAIFYDPDVFGSVLNSRPYMESIVEANEWGRIIEIGERPLLFYYTDKREIFSADTVLGRISASHGISYGTPGPEGIHVDNKIGLIVDFESNRSINEAISSALDVLRFLEVFAGRRQKVLELSILLKSIEKHPVNLDVYWCMPPSRTSDDDSHKPYHWDLPIQTAIRPNEFAQVLKSWLERNDEWRDARVRYSNGSVNENKYSIERLIGAANMFNILPSSTYSENVSLSSDIIQARENARKQFRSLPTSPERDSILGALGRIGKATLKRKVRDRATLVTDIIGSRFPDLEMVVDLAVDCRNHYVHGSPTKLEYQKQFIHLSFFTDTLEFIFAASDLIDSGWNISAWSKSDNSLSHPFGKYLHSYSNYLSKLKEDI